jgi:hypothetical protein
MNYVLKSKINNMLKSEYIFRSFYDHSNDRMVLADGSRNVCEWSSEWFLPQNSQMKFTKTKFFGNF